EVSAAVRDDREARLAVQGTVVADVRGAVRYLAGVRMHEELRHEPLTLSEVLQRAQIDLGIALALERRHDHEADRGHRHETTDDAAQAEGRALEEPAARKALARLGHCRLAPIRRDGRRSGRLPRTGALRPDRR